jgi:ABC-type transport system involved in cytochrome c biogenesis permease subunit
MNILKRYAVFFVLGFAVIYLGFSMRSVEAPANSINFAAAGRLPVQHDARLKPWDTMARVCLLMISNRQTWRDEDDKQHTAIEWLLDVLSCGEKNALSKDKPPLSASLKMFRIEDAESRQLLGLPDQEDNLYSFEQFSSRFRPFAEAVKDRLESLNGRTPDALDSRMRALALQIIGYMQYAQYETSHEVFRIENLELLALVGLDRREGLRYSFSELLPRMSELVRESERVEEIPQKQRTEYETAVAKLQHGVELYLGLATHSARPVQLVPPLERGEKWRTLAQAEKDGDDSPAPLAIDRILSTYAKGEPRGFNQAVADYRRLLDAKVPDLGEKTRFEAFYNHFEPFTKCIYLYVLMFLLAAVSWIVWDKPLGRSAFWLGILIFGLEFWALIARMYMQDRIPPVTNLYSSAIFVGFIGIIFGLVLECVFSYAIASAASSILGFGTALLAHHLAESGDTMHVMEAVLDTNFWLATHVVAVTMGYGATLLAGVLGVSYVTRGVLTPSLRPELAKNLSSMIYGILCFATLFSFTGTVLGGIWADQSWGRFWGWDPKENGALIIVIWNALILHARWAGMVKQRGMVVLSVVGIMVTMWSWIGTNQLGVGLHAYGFNNTLAMIADGTWFACIAVMAMGLIPTRHWQSFQRQAQ